jgi:hypothetical protein
LNIILSVFSVLIYIFGEITNITKQRQSIQFWLCSRNFVATINKLAVIQPQNDVKSLILNIIKTKIRTKSQNKKSEPKEKRIYN